MTYYIFSKEKLSQAGQKTKYWHQIFLLINFGKSQSIIIENPNILNLSTGKKLQCRRVEVVQQYHFPNKHKDLEGHFAPLAFYVLFVSR